MARDGKPTPTAIALPECAVPQNFSIARSENLPTALWASLPGMVTYHPAAVPDGINLIAVWRDELPLHPCERVRLDAWRSAD
jgi:hypothetical protein